jgi:hypothetical protein
MAECAKIVWIMFGNIERFESDVEQLKKAYRGHKGSADNCGYTLGIPDYPQTKSSLRTLLQDRATRGLVWHSHGAGTMGGFTGQIITSPMEPLSAGDLSGWNLKLEFAALFGCGIAKDSATLGSWKRAFGLDRYGGNNGSFESRFVADTVSSWFWGQKANVKASAQRFAEHELLLWLKRLSVT